ncbi:oligosaccharide flippase family protein [Candidatus Pacearchaeota archaeon]|nr:oligosaccharide flippase family protein [Candidatus Pacearchaeota archaeon]
MARVLGPVDYGILAVLTSIIAIFGIASVSIQTVISQNTTNFNSKKEYGKIKGMLKSASKSVFLVATLSFLLYLIVSIFIYRPLGIPYSLLALTGAFIFGAFLYPITAGILQGMKKFSSLGFNFVINCLIKLVVGVLLVAFGFKVYGAVIGFISGTIIAFLLVFFTLKEIKNVKEIDGKVSIFSRYNFYPLVAMLLVVLLYSLDVVFAKIFFSPEIAGKYAVISMIGKIILFIVMSVGNVMLPISTEKFANGEKTRSTLKKALLLSLLICLFFLALFFIFPELIIQILFGFQYSSMYNILFYVGVAFSFISLLSLLVLYEISLNRFRFFHLLSLIFFLALQITLFYYSNLTIDSFSFYFMLSSIIAFIGILAVFMLLKLKNGQIINNNV